MTPYAYFPEDTVHSVGNCLADGPQRSGQPTHYPTITSSQMCHPGRHDCSHRCHPQMASSPLGETLSSPQSPSSPSSSPSCCSCPPPPSSAKFCFCRRQWFVAWAQGKWSMFSSYLVFCVWRSRGGEASCGLGVKGGGGRGGWGR